MKPLVIIGAGGFGRETVALVEDINAMKGQWLIKGFVDDAADLSGATIMGYPVLGTLDWLTTQRGLHYVIAVGASLTRRRLAQRLGEIPHEAAKLIHPSAAYHATTLLGPGAIICRGASLTVSIGVGRHVIADVHSTIGHDTNLGDFVTLHPGVHISGGAIIGQAVELGTGSVVLPSICIGEETIVGAGAVVNRSLPACCTAVGVPARPLDARS